MIATSLEQWLNGGGHREEATARFAAIADKFADKIAAKRAPSRSVKLEMLGPAILLHALESGRSFGEALKSMPDQLRETLRPDIAIVEAASWFCGLLWGSVRSPQRFTEAGRAILSPTVFLAVSDVGQTLARVTGAGSVPELVVRRAMTDYAKASPSDSIGLFAGFVARSCRGAPTGLPELSLPALAYAFFAEEMGEAVAGVLELADDVLKTPADATPRHGVAPSQSPPPSERPDGSTLRAQLREQLLDSYKPRALAGTACAKCSAAGQPLAFHIAEYGADGPPPDRPPLGCVVMSSRRYGDTEGWNGSFPVCTSCAPPCRSCGLPLPTSRVLDWVHELGRRGLPGRVRQGLGFCDEFHVSLFASALVRRALRLGRFGVAPAER